MNAPVTLPCPVAWVGYWPRIAQLFRHGLDTHQIARELRIHEACVANALTEALRANR